MESNPDDKGVQELLNSDCVNNEEIIERIIHSIAASPAIDQSLREAESFSNRALDLISELPDSEEKNELINLTKSSVVRKN